MIDPKFNELPTDAEGDFVESPEASLTDRQGQGTQRQGLSINDTVAANANLSVGSRGVDTSGSSAGSGAGAGMTMTTAGDEVTPAPIISPGARGSGTTPRGDSASQLAPGSESEASTSVAQSTTDSISSTSTLSPTTRLEAGTENTGTHLLGTDEFSISEISERAYHCWIERGSPHGSPEIDWATAVEQLRAEKRRSIAATA